MFKDSFNPSFDEGAYPGGAARVSDLSPVTSLSPFFNVAQAEPELRSLGKDDVAQFVAMHTHTRLSMPDEDRRFMKELKPAVLDYLIDKDMPVMGMFVGDKLVSGCAILYPSDPHVASYLPGYDFDGREENVAVVSAVWTHPDYTGKGYSKKAIEAGMQRAVIEAGRDTFMAKVDKQNSPSLGMFEKFSFDIAVEGQDAQKVYPTLSL